MNDKKKLSVADDFFSLKDLEELSLFTLLNDKYKIKFVKVET